MTAQPVRQLRPTLDELARPCTRCGCQSAVHTRGASRSGWPVFDPTWAAAAGACSTPDCPCPARSSDPNVEQVHAAAVSAVPDRVVAPPPSQVTRLNGPCSYGSGPCGAVPTRPFVLGPRCAAHEPGAGRG